VNHKPVPFLSGNPIKSPGDEDFGLAYAADILSLTSGKKNIKVFIFFSIAS
jgi:hypothetical protein